MLNVESRGKVRFERGPVGRSRRRAAETIQRSAFVLQHFCYSPQVELDVSGWSGEGDFTRRLIDVIGGIAAVHMLKVEDAPASQGDAAFSFISNELFVVFTATERVVRGRRFGFLPSRHRVAERSLTLAGLGAALSQAEDVGEPDYTDEGMLQYLRVERIVPPYQTRGYKLVELVRIYDATAVPENRA